MKIFKFKKDKSGIALILVLGILAVLVTLATTFAFNSRLEQKAAKNNMFAIMAYDVAKAGIEHSIASMKIYALEQAHMIYTDNWYYTSSSEPSFDEYNGNTDDSVTGVMDFGDGTIGTYNLKIVDTASQIFVNHGETTGRLDEILEELGVGAGQGTNIINYRNGLPDKAFLTKEQVKETNSTVLGNYSNFDDFIAVNGYINDKVCLASEGFTGLSYHDCESTPWSIPWTDHSATDTWYIEYEELSQNDTGAGTKILSYDNTRVDNFTALFKVKVVGGTSWAGFQFRKTNAGDDFNGTGYTVRFHQDGRIDIYEATGGVIDSESAGTISDTDVFHTVKLTANGNQLNVSVDGTAYLSASDSTYTSGCMAFITEGDVHAHFDSFEVTTSLPLVCVNTASRDVLVAVLKDLSDGTNTVSQSEAETAADAIINYIKTSPNTIKTWAGFDSIIDGTGLGAAEKLIIKANANPNTPINLSAYSVPFCFHGSGFFEIECLAKVGRDFNSDGVLNASDDEICAEKRIKTIIKVFDIWYVNTEEDFEDGATTTNCDMLAYPGLLQIADRNLWVEAEDRTASGGENAENNTNRANSSDPDGVNPKDVYISDSAPDLGTPPCYLENDDISLASIGNAPSNPTDTQDFYVWVRQWEDAAATSDCAKYKLSFDTGSGYNTPAQDEFDTNAGAGSYVWKQLESGGVDITEAFGTGNNKFKIAATGQSTDAIAAASALYELDFDAYLFTLDNAYNPSTDDSPDYDDPNYYSGTILFESSNSPTIDISAGDKWGAILFTEYSGGTVAVKTENSGGGETSSAYTNGDEIDSSLDDNNAIRLQIELTRGGAAGLWTTPKVDDVIITYVPVTRILYWAEW